MTTENIIYKPLIDTEDNLKTRLANGEFGFSTSTSAIVFKGPNGGTETFRNPDGSSTKVETGTSLPTTGLENNLLFILIGSVNDGLYRYSDTDTAWNIVTPLATATKNGRLTFTDFTKIQNIETTATNIVNNLVPEITSTTGGKLSNIDAVKFASIDSDAEKNVRSVYTETDSTVDSFIFNKPTELANINSTEGSKLTNIQIRDITPGNGLVVNDGVISLNQINLSDTEVFTTKVLRNADTTTVWHKGDVAIITAGTDKGSYIYTGTDQTSAGITVDGDWTHLETPTDVVTSVEGKTGIVLLDEATSTRKGLATAAQISSLTNAINRNTQQDIQIGSLQTTQGFQGIDITSLTNRTGAQDALILANTAKETNIQSDFTATTNATGQILNLPTFATVATTGEYSDILNTPVNVFTTTPISTLPIGFNADGTNNLTNGHTVNLNTAADQILSTLPQVQPGTRFYNIGNFTPSTPAGNSRIDINIDKTLFDTSVVGGEKQIILQGFTSGSATLGGVANLLNITTSAGSGTGRSGVNVFYFDNDPDVDTWLAAVVGIMNGDANLPVTVSLVNDETDSVTMRLQWATNALLGEPIVEGTPGGINDRQPGFINFDFTDGSAIAAIDDSRWF